MKDSQVPLRSVNYRFNSRVDSIVGYVRWVLLSIWVSVWGIKVTVSNRICIMIKIRICVCLDVGTHVIDVMLMVSVWVVEIIMSWLMVSVYVERIHSVVVLSVLVNNRVIIYR